MNAARSRPREDQAKSHAMNSQALLDDPHLVRVRPMPTAANLICRKARSMKQLKRMP
jgi:hypothetical protein